LKECGAMLAKITPKGSIGHDYLFLWEMMLMKNFNILAVFERLRAVLNDCDSIEERTQYMIETIFHIRKNKFEVFFSLFN
jgi:hypothetical protein